MPSEFQDVPTDLGSGIRIVDSKVLIRTQLGLRHQPVANLPGVNPMSNVFDMLEC